MKKRTRAAARPAAPEDTRAVFELAVDDISAIGSMIPEFGESGAVFEAGKLYVPAGALAERVAQLVENLDATRRDAALMQLRALRDRRLKACDWTQLQDALTAPKRKAWAIYRNALRDLPDTADPANPEWPVEPGSKA